MKEKQISLELDDTCWILGVGIIPIAPGPLSPKGGNVCVTVFRKIDAVPPCDWMLNIRVRYYKDDKIQQSSDIRQRENWVLKNGEQTKVYEIANRLLGFLSFAYNRKDTEDKPPTPNWFIVEGTLEKMTQLASDPKKRPEWLSMASYPFKKPDEPEPSDDGPEDYEST